MEGLKVEISSVPDRENLVAEIWLNNIMIAEVNQEFGSLEIEFYFDKRSTSFDYECFLNALIEAKKRLNES